MKSKTKPATSLGFRLSVGYAALVAAIVTIFGVVLFLGMQRVLGTEIDQRLKLRSDQVQLVLWPSPDAPQLEDLSAAKLDLSPLADLDAPGLYVQLRDLQGNVLASSASLGVAILPMSPTQFQLALKNQPAYGTFSIDRRAVRTLTVPIIVQGQPAAILQVAESRQPLEQALVDLKLLLILFALAVCGGVGVLGWVVTRHGLSPLNSMAGQAAAIARRRDFAQQLEVPEHTAEVQQLATTINELLRTVEEVLRHHREFIADTSHELRNPLLAIRGNLELLSLVEDDASREECVREALQQADRMSRLVSDILSLAQVESGLLIEPQLFDLRELVGRAVHSFDQRIADRRFSVVGEGYIQVMADAGRLEQVLTNLLDNAVRHTAQGGSISVALAVGPGLVAMTVTDDGEGIAPRHLARIFDRFYRVGGDLSESSPRLGFGLPIVRHIVERHGGWVTVNSTQGEGSEFTVWLPLPAFHDSDVASERERPRAQGSGVAVGVQPETPRRVILGDLSRGRTGPSAPLH